MKPMKLKKNSKKNFLPTTILYVCVLIVKKCCCGVFELEKGGELK